MTKIRSQPKPNWEILTKAGCENVEFRVLLGVDGIMLANLRFSKNGAIDEHDAPHDIDVVCISGSGFTSVDGETFPFQAGQTIRWPRNKKHRLWTESTLMETIMVERYES